LVAKLLVPIISKVLSSTKSKLMSLSLIGKSDLPPGLQAMGKKPLYDIDEDIISLVGRTAWASTTSSSCFGSNVHGVQGSGSGQKFIFRLGTRAKILVTEAPLLD
jgi:hypothetical protein